MKKITKIIIINFLIFISLFLIADFFCYHQYLHNKNYLNRGSVEPHGFFKTLFSRPVKNFDETIALSMQHKSSFNRLNVRSDYYIDSNKNSILLLGCSYTFGSLLEYSQTFSYKLQNYTKRQVYNRGLAGFGIQHAIYILEHPELLPNDDYEYVIYTFIEDHIHRLFKINDFFELYYKFYKYYEKSDKFVSYTDFDLLLFRFNMFRSIYLHYYEFVYKQKWDQFINIMKYYFLYMNKLVKKINNNTQLVIFVYNGDASFDKIRKNIEEAGIKVVYLTELSKTNYYLPEYKVDEQHPNEKAWNEIVPLLSKNLKL